MTKKDYILIANQLYDGVTFANHGTSASQTMRSVIYNLSIAFAIDNPQFDGEKFFKACGLERCKKCGHSLPLPQEEFKHECQ